MYITPPEGAPHALGHSQMAARILHFGKDSCNRVAVLRSAGYSVDACLSLANLDSALHSDGEVDAVIMSDAREVARHDALALVHSSSSAPVVLFEHTTYSPDEAYFDLIVRNLTPVRDWLNSIAATIQRSRDICAESRMIRERSSALLQQTAAVREESIKQRERYTRLRTKAKEILGSDPEKPTSDSK